MRKTVWSNQATKQLKMLYDYIRKNSYQNAVTVRNDIVVLVRKIAEHPEKYGPDKYKINNDGSYRSFEKHRYRISYRILSNEIRILRVRHTSMEPLGY